MAAADLAGLPAGGEAAAVNTTVQAMLDGMAASGVELGVQVAAYHRGRLVVDAWSGVADTATARPVDAGTLFNVFSVVKAVTVTAVHMQAERGLIDYDTPVAHYWPEFGAAGKGDIRVSHVLAHKSGVFVMPPEVTPALMCNWDWMVARIAASESQFPAGSESGYQSMTMGWLCGELVRRTDPKGRPFEAFVREEIAEPLGIPDLWVGLPAREEARVAIMDGSRVADVPDGTLYRLACPRQVDLMPEPFGQSMVRQACIPGVGGIMTARSEARFFAMLAGGGCLDGVRLLSSDRLEAASRPRDAIDPPDRVFFGATIPISVGGYWLGGSTAPTAAAKHRDVICHPGMGGSIGFADRRQDLAVAFCHNRLQGGRAPDEDPGTLVANAIRAGLGLD